MPVHPELSDRPSSPHTRRWRVEHAGRAALLVLLAVVTLAACTDGGGGNPEPSPTVSASRVATTSSSTPSPTPSRTEPLLTGPNVRPGEKPPSLPSYAQTHDASGAVSFAEYYVRALDWSLATNDPYLLRKVALPTCTACAAQIGEIVDLKAKSHRLTGGRVSLSRSQLETRHYKIDADQAVRVTVDQAPQIVYGKNSVVVARRPAEEVTSLVFLRWESRWFVREVSSTP